MSVAVVTRLTGNAFIVRGSENIPLTLNAGLDASDSVLTEADATVELRLADGTVIKLGPSTQVEIKDFAVDSQDADTSSLMSSMLEGAVRSASAKVVELNQEGFKQPPPTGTVGIRG